jgi:hypothetical protein
MTDRHDGAPWVDQDAVLAAVQAHAQALTLPDWPVFGLAADEGVGWLAGAAEQDGVLRSIRLDYRPPDEPARLVVQTQPDDGVVPDLSLVAAQLRTSEGQPLRLTGAPAGRRDGELDVLVDGRTVRGTIHRHGDTSVWSVTTRGVLTVVAASGPEVSRPALTEITDLGPYKRRRVAMVARLLSRGAG